MDTSSFLTSELRDKLVFQLNYLTRDEIIHHLSLIPGKPKERVSLPPPLLLIKGKEIKYFKFKQGEYHLASEIKDINSLNFNEIDVEAGPVENTLLFVYNEEVFSWNVKTNVITKLFKLENLALFRRAKEVGTYLYLSRNGPEFELYLLEFLPNKKVKNTLKFKFVPEELIDNIRQVDFDTFIINIFDQHEIYYKGKKVKIPDSFPYDYVISSSLISWGWDEQKIVSISENTKIKQKTIPGHNSLNLFSIEVIPLNSEMIAEYGNEGSENGRKVMNIYSFRDKKLRLIQKIIDTNLPTPINSDYFITSNSSSTSSIWYFSGDDYITIQELKFGYDRAVPLLVDREDRKALTGILSPLIPVPKVLTDSVVNFL